MTIVMAALNGTPVSRVVLVVAAEVARVLDADIEGVHVLKDRRGDSAIEAETEAEAAARGIPLRMLEGAVEQMLVERAHSDEVRAVVMGLRRTVGGTRPAGHVALGVIARVRKPVVVVPPVTPLGFRLRKVLVPVQGRPADALENTMAIAESADLETVILHVHDEWSVPSFEDQPHYDVEAWAEEFIARWVPGARAGTAIELRVGTPEEQILDVARDVGADMIAMGWSQDLSPGRATVVRWALEHTPIPLALMPLARTAGAGWSKSTDELSRRLSA
jgi:nucleotide-binding universal stress UspA family protein